MTRGPRGLRSEVQHTRGYGGEDISGCLRDAGAEVVAKSQGSLMKTDLSRPMAMAGGETSELLALRAELEDRNRAFKALQRNYDSVSSVGAADREELQMLRKRYTDFDKEALDLQKDNDRLNKQLRDQSQQQSAASGDRQQLEQRASQAERKVKDLQEAATDAKKQLKDLQEMLKSERDKAQAIAKQLTLSQRAAESRGQELE
ncbi:unnamed protein product, partial [Polarella glacialis]